MKFQHDRSHKNDESDGVDDGDNNNGDSYDDYDYGNVADIDCHCKMLVTALLID